ncbi:MAG: NTP transferase domain-containing protein [Actinobacteria bacterium]|uniref:Unannotated protein n=1 Tax=freshwater metagenome TaxID=449393 RepID=A0A6J5YHE0_9ZZZZ|nr:NTP transferase domain-containing protein [Actinomycetota bacterium]MTA77355.1 NTP transferase domain-containing protein [Actinomycetota bacterium]
MIEPFSGAILAGGRSLRMGSDKAALDPYGHGSMLSTGLRSLEGCGASGIAVVGGAPLLPIPDGVEPVADLFPGEGPLGGIISALRWSRSDLVVVLACDMPFLTEEPIMELVSLARGSHALAGVFAKIDGRIQPLTAIWRRSLALELLTASFGAGERAPRRLLDRLPHETIICENSLALIDLDSRDDIERYAHLARERTTGES